MCYLSIFLFAAAMLCGAGATISWYAVANRLYRDGYPANLIRNSPSKTNRILKTYSEVAPSKGWPLWPARGFTPLFLLATLLLLISAATLSRWCPF